MPTIDAVPTINAEAMSGASPNWSEAASSSTPWLGDGAQAVALGQFVAVDHHIAVAVVVPAAAAEEPGIERRADDKADALYP